MKKKLLAFLLVPLCALLFSGCTLFNGEEEVDTTNGQAEEVVDENETGFGGDFVVDIDDVIDPEDLEEGELEEDEEAEVVL